MLLAKMLKQKLQTIRVHYSRQLGALLLIGGLAVGFLLSPLVTADRFDEQINQINQDSAAKRQNVGTLDVQAADFNDKIAKLQAQINDLQGQIGQSEKEIDQTQVKITQAEEELAKQKKLLGENIKTMYLEGQISTLEMLASSKNLSEFVDKEQYRNNVKDKIKDNLDKINALKLELKSEKERFEGQKNDQEIRQQQVNAQANEQARLLALNSSERSALNDQIKTNNAQVSGLRAQQAAENARLFSGATLITGGSCDTGHGDTYPQPWCSALQDSVLDYWGMYNRECVSYTAWKVSETGRYMPYWGGRGNANQWDDDARADGIPVDSNPRAGDVAIKNSQPYGHAMYVESVNGNGTINISQYNADLQGHFSRAYNLSSAGLVFIHF